MRNLIKRFAVASLLLAAVAGLPRAAGACYYACMFVDEVCQRCLYAGGYTGGYCKNSGTCSCLDVRGTCDGAAAAPMASGASPRVAETPQSRALAAIFAAPADASR